jgi:hypothetical protein
MPKLSRNIHGPFSNFNPIPKEMDEQKYTRLGQGLLVFKGLLVCSWHPFFILANSGARLF